MKTVQGWVLAALGILIAVIVSYDVFSTQSSEDNHGHEQGQAEEHQENGEHDHQHVVEDEVNSTIEVDVKYHNNLLTVNLVDENGEVPSLEMNHEKKMHLILVSEDLESFVHLHPEQMSDGSFTVESEHESRSYQVFVDIVPTNGAYQVQPISLHGVGHDHEEHQHQPLVESEKTVRIEDIEVTLGHEPIIAGEQANLHFSVNADVEPYLGALGHVVIVNEMVDSYIHVHPKSIEEPIFAAHFEKAGMYKLWAEFKIDGEVYAFPYVLEVLESEEGDS
ncbi:hypothetical protein [Bacillus suaedae]|uniref:Secreted protein n=1 Tax=Halalkalibacter suaedae TaxID=2822140 RepID=A0A941AMA2_9BACI|nr:hypothetical protein [Bacillus suaedae]MBP3950290.1 hypothetical protein [Bacillus suaedae]